MASSEGRDSDEDELIQLLKRQDARAYRLVADRHLKAVLNYAYRILGNQAEAEDVSQETFLRFWQQAPKWEARAKVNTWLFKVAHNLSVDRLRQRKPVTDSNELPTDSAKPSHVLERRGQIEAVQNALARLPERQRAALVMAHFDGMTNPEIGEVLSISVEAVESLLSRARRALRQALSEFGEGS